eukprot:4917237-Ditylum_brightwellii.AAC.1
MVHLIFCMSSNSLCGHFLSKYTRCHVSSRIGVPVPALICDYVVMVRNLSPVLVCARMCLMAPLILALSWAAMTLVRPMPPKNIVAKTTVWGKLRVLP